MDKLKRIIKKFQLRYYKNDSWDYVYTNLALIHPNQLILNKRTLILKQLNIEINRDTFQFLLEGYHNAWSLIELIDAKFNIKDNQLYIKVGTLKFEVQTSEELFILKEIFVDGVYNFHLNEISSKYIMIDIGMNVSYASCYFASHKNVSHVISFEPFTPTFKQAQKNISLNNLENRIDIRNYGLGGNDETVSIDYAPSFKGQMNMLGTDYIRSNITYTIKEKINIKKAFEPLNQIEQENSTKKFIMKIDCEGAEYDFIYDIPEALLQRCDLIMMEWHEKGPSSIEKWLTKNSFMQMSFYPHSKRAGMIYAVKFT